MNQPCENPCVSCEPLPGGIGTNPIFPDPNVTGNPFVNYSSERPDVNVFVGTFWPPPGEPPIGTQWRATFCDGGICVSDVSQEDADLCAQRAGVVCVGNDWPVTIPNPGADDPVPPGFPPPPPTIPVPRVPVPNTPQSCTITCSDGHGFGFAVAAGKFFGFNQAEADKLARDYACLKANQNAMCLTDFLPNAGCLDQFMSINAAISGTHTGIVVTLAAGALPPGLTLSNTNSIITLEGMPTSVGTYTFALHVVDALGNANDRDYIINVGTITTPTLPAGQVGQPYSATLAATNIDDVFWSVKSGALPDGLTLDDATGEISGTPTTAADYHFTIKATGAGFGCTKEYDVSINGGGPCVFNDLVWGAGTCNPLVNSSLGCSYVPVNSITIDYTGGDGVNSGVAEAQNVGSAPLEVAALITINVDISYVTTAPGTCTDGVLEIRSTNLGVLFSFNIANTAAGDTHLEFDIPPTAGDTLFMEISGSGGVSVWASTNNATSTWTVVVTCQ